MEQNVVIVNNTGLPYKSLGFIIDELKLTSNRTNKKWLIEYKRLIIIVEVRYYNKYEIWEFNYNTLF